MISVSEITEILDAATLRDIVDHLEIECADRRRLDSLKSAIARSNVSAMDILDSLTVSQLKDIASELGLSTGGRRDILIERIATSEIDDTDEEDAIRSENPAPEPVANSAETEAELSAFREWLEVGLNTEQIAEGVTNSGFCPACKKRHARKWFNYKGSPRGFYLCYVGQPKLVDSPGEGSKFTVHSLVDYCSEIPIDIPATEAIAQTEKRSWWQRIIGAGVVSGTHVVRHIRVDSISMIPPHINLKVDGEHLSEALRKGKAEYER